MALTPGQQMMNPIPAGGSITDWNKEVEKRRAKAIVAGITIPVPGSGYAKAIRGIAIFLAAAGGVELIGMVADLVTRARPRPQVEVKKDIERWLTERYGDVYKARISTPLQPRGPRKNRKPGKGAITPFVYPEPEVERALEDVFRVAPPKKGEEPDSEEVAGWLERRFSQNIVRFQRLGAAAPRK